MHNAVWLNDNSKCFYLNRTEHIHPYQLLIDNMKNLDVSYIDAYFNLFNHNFHFGVPFLMGFNKNLISFLNENKFKYSQKIFYKNINKTLEEYMVQFSKQIEFASIYQKDCIDPNLSMFLKRFQELVEYDTTNSFYYLFKTIIYIVLRKPLKYKKYYKKYLKSKK